MPLIYNPNVEKKHTFSLILHHRTKPSNQTNENDYVFSVPDNLNIIDPSTKDYKSFISEILASEFIISSSLHGIIIAESYGVPAVFLNFGVSDQVVKFNDWYKSTGRELNFCKSVNEAIMKKGQTVPNLEEMQQSIMSVFPYDIWEE